MWKQIQRRNSQAYVGLSSKAKESNMAGKSMQIPDLAMEVYIIYDYK
jgi:hypothetical protein